MIKAENPKIISKFYSENFLGDTIFSKLITVKYGTRKKIHAYLKKKKYCLNYLEYSILEKLFLKYISKYKVSKYSYSKDNFQYIGYDNLLDSLERFKLIYNFSELINKSDFKNQLISPNERINNFLKLYKSYFDINLLMKNIFDFKINNGKISKDIYLYIDLLIYFSLISSYKVINTTKGIIIQLIIKKPKGYIEIKLSQSIEIINVTNLIDINKLVKIIKGYSFKEYLEITKNKYKFEKAIILIKQLIAFNKGINIKFIGINKPLDIIKYTNNDLLIFTDDKEYFKKISRSNQKIIFLTNIDLETGKNNYINSAKH